VREILVDKGVDPWMDENKSFHLYQGILGLDTYVTENRRRHAICRKNGIGIMEKFEVVESEY